MIIIGLTGSIGMGKTTTAQGFKDEGCPVFDADKAVHSLYARGGEMVPIIAAVFPDCVMDGEVLRPELSQKLRADPLNYTVLESYVHPLVAKARQDFLKVHESSDIVVLDVPLLFETGGDDSVDHLVVVTAPPAVQRERVMARDGMSPALFNSLLSRQMPDTEKRARADSLVFTDKGLVSAREQVQDILKKLRGN